MSAKNWIDGDYLGGKLFTLRGRFQVEDDNVLFITASLRKTREMIVIACAEGLLTDEEFVFLYETNRPVNLELPYNEYDQFESLFYRSLVYTEFDGLTGNKVIRNFSPNFASFDRSFFEFVRLTDEYFPAEKEIVLFLSFHAR